MAEPVVAVDANGADLGPAEVAAGAALAAAQGARVLLFGPAAELGEQPAGVEVVDAPVSIAKAPDPVGAARVTRDASIVLATRAVAEGRADALVCAGGTGAALAAGTFNIKRDRGIYRPALAMPLPVPGNPVTLLDVGASAEARREHLVQFAFMGAALARIVLGVRPAPRRAALQRRGGRARRASSSSRPGAELRERAGAGDAGRHGAPDNPSPAARHRAPADSSRAAGHRAPADPSSFTFFEFVGNVEGGDLLAGAADVVVTDGFTGNVALKVLEGTSQVLLRDDPRRRDGLRRAAARAACS